VVCVCVHVRVCVCARLHTASLVPGLLFQMKTGPFAEHSNQLWNISAVPSWSKVNQGLIRMYKAEVSGGWPSCLPLMALGPEGELMTSDSSSHCLLGL
jgi:hypothetical protein